MTGVFLQARIDSTRLPGKVILPLGGRTVIDLAMLALLKVDADVHALLTDTDSSSALEPCAERCGFSLFTGDKEDVLKRFADAAVLYGVDTIVRATGDNPLVSASAASEILGHHRRKKADFSCFTGLPLGTGVEVVRTDALLHSHRSARDPYEREHVNPFLYRRETMFDINRVPAPREFSCPEARVTLDTPRDYEYLQTLFEELYHNVPLELDTVVPWVRKHPRTTGSE